MSEIALFDADGTLHADFSIFPLFRAFADEKFIPAAASLQLDEVYESYQSGQLGYHDFAVKTLEVAADAVAGRRVVPAEAISAAFFTADSFAWFNYVAPLFEKLQQRGVEPILVTAEPQFIAKGIARAVPFRKTLSTHFGEEDGRFTGQIIDVLGSTRKAELVLPDMQSSEYSFAFGDSEGDMAMLQAADQAVCIQPTPGLRTEAEQHNWIVIDNPDVPLPDTVG